MVCTKDKEDGGELWLCSEWPKVDMMVLSSRWQWQLPISCIEYGWPLVVLVLPSINS